MTAIEHRDPPAPDIIVENATSLTASRRAGNLWTPEARDDMFNRRERGEPWESICQDYPTRSRHAMQQQYSMMKKQRMMADGTWTTNRRGRKRKVLPTTPASVGPRRESGLETTEDEFASVTPSDLDPDDPDDMAVDEIELGTPAPESNGSTGPSQSVLDFRPGRPSGLSRSATDPAPAPRGRGRGRGRVASTYTHADGAHLPLAPKSFTAVNDEIKVHKRSLHENATPPAPKRQKSQGETPAAEGQTEIKVPFSEASVYFTKEDLTAFFKKGLENGERARRMIDDDCLSREKVFQEAQGRANRRAYEAEERIKEMGYRHRSDIRMLEHSHAEKLENVQYEYDQKIEELTKQLAEARGVDPASIEVSQSTAKPAAVQASAGAPTLPTSDASAPDGSDPDVLKQVIALVTNLEELKARFETERELRKKAEARAVAATQEKLAAALQNAAPDFLHEFQQLEAMVTRLLSEVGDLTPNALAKVLAEIRGRCAQCASHFRPQQQYYAPLSHPGPESRGTPPTPVHMHAVAAPPPPPPTAAAQGIRPDSVNPPLPPSQQHYVAGPHGLPPQPPHGSQLPAFHNMTGSPSPSPLASVKHEGHPISAPHPGLPTPSEAPFESTPFEQKRSTPVTINQLLQQEPAVVHPPNLPALRNTAASPPYDHRSPPTHSPTVAHGPMQTPPPMTVPSPVPPPPPPSGHMPQMEQTHMPKMEPKMEPMGGMGQSSSPNPNHNQQPLRWQ